MVVLLVVGTFVVFLTIDTIRSMEIRVPRGTSYTTPGFEGLGCLAQDGGIPVEKAESDYEI
jgi:hypothetical protein